MKAESIKQRERKDSEANYLFRSEQCEKEGIIHHTFLGEFLARITHRSR